MLLMSEATYFPNTVFDDDDEDADAPSTPTTLSMFRPFIRGRRCNFFSFLAHLIQLCTRICCQRLFCLWLGVNAPQTSTVNSERLRKRCSLTLTISIYQPGGRRQNSSLARKQWSRSYDAKNCKAEIKTNMLIRALSGYGSTQSWPRQSIPMSYCFVFHRGCCDGSKKLK